MRTRPRRAARDRLVALGGCSVEAYLLEPSNHRTTCAYKGHASYLSVRGGERDIAWWYVEPLDDAARVAGHVCFWNERTDLFLDGVEVPRPVTPWSPAEEVARADPDRLEFG